LSFTLGVYYGNIIGMQIFLNSKWNEKIVPALPGADKFFKLISRHLLMQDYPVDLVMLTVELHDMVSESCEIIFICADSGEHLGRSASYSQCVFSQYSSRLDQTVSLPRVKTQPGYLSLSPAVNSEMFYEHRISDRYAWIMNGEFSSVQIKSDAAQWFNALVDRLEKG